MKNPINEYINFVQNLKSWGFSLKESCYQAGQFFNGAGRNLGDDAAEWPDPDEMRDGIPEQAPDGMVTFPDYLKSNSIGWNFKFNAKARRLAEWCVNKGREFRQQSGKKPNFYRPEDIAEFMEQDKEPEKKPKAATAPKAAKSAPAAGPVKLTEAEKEQEFQNSFTFHQVADQIPKLLHADGFLVADLIAACAKMGMTEETVRFHLAMALNKAKKEISKDGSRIVLTS